MINKNIFRGYDIRGVYKTDIDANVATTIGASFGTYIKKLGKTNCVVGHDNRYSSEELTNALIKGIRSTGVNVTYLGLVTTPMYYFGCLFQKIDSGIMVTASHNPKDDNGFKIAFTDYLNAKGKEIEDFRDFTLLGKFDKGNGQLKEINIKEDYFKLIESSINIGARKLKVIVDCANATTSYFAKELYSKFNIDLEMLFDLPDSNFPNHHPDPCVTENMEILKKKVIEGHFDLGIAFDGDGDRVGIVTEKGEHIGIDKVMIIIARDLIPKNKDKRFLFDVKCSKALEDEIIKLKGIPIQYRTGNSYLKNKIKLDNIPFGGEYSGHLFFNDKFPGFDSGMYAGLRIIEILSKTDKKLSNLLDGINEYYSTPELKFNSTDTLKFEVIEKIKENYKNALTLDGLKVVYDDGFALVRVSNTGPVITARFEAKTKERLNEIQTEFTNLINKYNKKRQI
ncbi:MAG: phosphomannomutase/phosphoglucomutase [Bacilli bacterium]